jgi:hypothetical protein
MVKMVDVEQFCVKCNSMQPCKKIPGGYECETCHAKHIITQMNKDNPAFYKIGVEGFKGRENEISPNVRILGTEGDSTMLVVDFRNLPKNQRKLFLNMPLLKDFAMNLKKETDKQLQDQIEKQND